MSKIGKRIKSVILKGKTFWNWKKEDDINVNIPVPKDYRNKVSYETNVEFVFNREVIASFSYNDPSQIPSMDDLIPAGYKLLYDNENTIQPYNNNRYVLVYDYYDLIVHYRNASDPNTDIKVYKGRYQYGTLITANMIDWPANKNGKEEWIEFPIGELTPARVTDKYVYFTNGASSSTNKPVSEELSHNTEINLNVSKPGEEYESVSSSVIIPGYIDDEYLKKYIKGRLPLGVNPVSNFDLNIRKGSVNNIDITTKSNRIAETPQAYYVGKNADIRTTTYVNSEGHTRTRFEIAPIIWYDERNPYFRNPGEYLAGFLDRLIPSFNSGTTVPGGTYVKPFESNTKMNNILSSYRIFDNDGGGHDNAVFIYYLNKQIFDFKNSSGRFTPAVFNIGDLLKKYESGDFSGDVPRITDNAEYYRAFFSLMRYSINTDVVNNDFTYKVIRDFNYKGTRADLLVYEVPLKRMKYIGVYTDASNYVVSGYYSNLSNDKPIISRELATNMYNKLCNETEPSWFVGYKVNTYKELNPVVDDRYDYQTAMTPEILKNIPGDVFTLSNPYQSKYMNTHSLFEIRRSARLIGPLGPYYFDDPYNSWTSRQTRFVIDETSIAMGIKKSSVKIADDVTQKYRIHFFDETGSEMKHYYTDQIIKEGTPPSPYPPRGYVVDPDRPWTRNPDNNKEIYVYLKKKICRVIVKANVSNPNNIKNKYWNAILGDNILLDTNKYVGEKINPATLFEGFKNTHSAKLKSVQIEDSAYNSMAELEIEDSITITFNFKVFKKDTMRSVFKLSEARKEFGIINPYFDYSLVPVLVKPEALKPAEVFEREEKTRTTNLVWYKEDLSNIHLDPKAGALETNIVYGNKLNHDILDNRNDQLLVSMKIYIIKEGIKTLVYDESTLRLDAFYYTSHFIWNNRIIHTNAYRLVEDKIGSGFSNIGHFLIDDINNLDKRDAFRIFFANSPDFLEKNIDLEVELEWSNELLDFRYKDKYPIDIRLIPSAILPYSVYGGRVKLKNFLNHSLGVNTIGYGLRSNNDHNIMFNMDIMYHNDFKRSENINENIDIYMNNAEAIAREAVKLTNIDMFIGTHGFCSRPWSISQLMPRPIAICDISYDWPLINNTSIQGTYKDTISYKLEDNNVFLVTNRDASKILNNKIIHNCFYNKFTNEESDVYDGTVVINDGLSEYSDHMSNKYINETALVMNSPKTRDILLRPTIVSTVLTSKYYISYGATSIEDWFKVMIELSTPNAVSSATIYADAYMDMLIGHTNYDNDVSRVPEVHNNPKGYKLLDFSYVKQDTEHPYINTSLFENSGRKRYIFHPKPNSIPLDIHNGFASLVRNYLEDGRVMKTYVSNTGDIIKTVENSAYKGYLEGKSKFVDYVISEITFASKLYNHKEFFFISAGMFESKKDAEAASNHDMNSQYDKWGDTFEENKDRKGYKDLIDKGEIVKYPADKKVFDKDSVIKLVYSGSNYHAISDIRHLKWHAIEEDNPTIVLDFERKYALDFVTPYSRNIIIPDLDKLVDYAFDRDANHRFLISDSSTWMEPVMWITGSDHREPMYIEGVGTVWQPDKNPQELNSNNKYRSNGLNSETNSIIGTSSRYDIRNLASRLYYALLMHDIYNNKKDDGYAVRQELYNPDNIIKYKYVRYPDNDAIDKFVNIHMYNNTVVSSDGETAVHLKASRYDYRFHPGSIHVKIFGYNMYDLLFKATSIFDLHSNDPNIENTSYDGNADYNVVYRWKLDKDISVSAGRRFNYSIGFRLVDEVNTIQKTNKDAYLKDTNRQINTIAPNIYHNFGMSEVGKYSHYLSVGDIYRPVIFNDEDIQGLNFKNSLADTFYTSENRTFMNHSTNNDAYKLINPYALVERNNGTPTGITFEDIFRKAWDPYTGHRFTGKSRLAGKLKYLYVTNLYNHYADPYNITTNWMLRVSKNSIHFGGAWNDERLVNDPSLITKTLNLIEQGLPQDPISAGSDRYKGGNSVLNPILINQFTAKNQAVAEHPMHIRYMCHPFQRTCLILIRLVTDNPAAGNTNMDTINLPVYMGYVNIRYEEIDKRKHDINLLKAYIKECALREDSGYKYYLKSFKYPYIFNTNTNKLFAFDVIENDPLAINVIYTEDHNSANPSYQFSAEFVLRAHIIGEDVKKPANADICDNRSLHHNGTNAIILYILDLKIAGVVRDRSDSGHLLNEEFYDAFKFLSTHSLERIEAAPKYNIPEYFVHKYSIFNGVKRFGWSAYNGQYLPKWPAFIPDNVTMLVSQNLLLIKDTVNVSSLSYMNPGIKSLRLLNTNIMLHPNFIGGIKDRKDEYVKFDSTKFYGSINIVDVSDTGESFADVNPKLTGFEYLSNRMYDIQRPGKERANATVTETSGMALSFYYIKYSMTTVASAQTKWFKQKAYDQIHGVFMHKEDYGKTTIHDSVSATTTPQEYLNKVYTTLNQPSLSSKGVSNFNLWDDGSSMGFRMDLNPMSTNIAYTTQRCAPTAIQWNFPMIYRRDTDIDFYKQRKYWTAFKNYEINEIAFNPYDSSGDLVLYRPWK